MSMAQFAQIKALEAELAELRQWYADLIIRVQALEQKKTTLEIPRKSA